MTFSERLYGPLDVDLCRVKLHEPLNQIVQQPLLYIRDMVPKPCFDALLKLHEVRQHEKLRIRARVADIKFLRRKCSPNKRSIVQW